MSTVLLTSSALETLGCTCSACPSYLCSSGSSPQVSRPSSAGSSRAPSACHCDSDCEYRASCSISPQPQFATSSEVRPLEGKTAVFVLSSTGARATMYQNLRTLGLYIVIVAPRPDTTVFGPECVDEWIVMDTTNIDDVEAALRQLAARRPIDAITSFDEYGVYPAAQLSIRFGRKPQPMPPAMLSVVNIKSKFREWCVLKKLGSPRFAAIKTREVDAAEAVRAAGMLYPMVVKPAPGAGSNLVQLCDNEAELVSAVARLWTAISAMNTAHFEALGERVHVLVEEFVEGPEVDVDAIVENGVVRFAAVSDNFPTVRPYFSEVGGMSPSQLMPNQQHALVRLLEEFVAAAATDGVFVHGVLHFEAKYDIRRDVAVIIEVNCRVGGAETFVMVKTAFGVDLGEASTRLALGAPLQPLPFRQPGQPSQGTGRICASANLYPKVEGKLVEIVPPPSSHPAHVASRPFAMAKGAPVLLPPHSFGCLLWLVAERPSAEQAFANMKTLCELSAIVVE